MEKYNKKNFLLAFQKQIVKDVNSIWPSPFPFNFAKTHAWKSWQTPGILTPEIPIKYPNRVFLEKLISRSKVSIRLEKSTGWNFSITLMKLAVISSDFSQWKPRGGDLKFDLLMTRPRIYIWETSSYWGWNICKFHFTICNNIFQIKIFNKKPNNVLMYYTKKVNIDHTTLNGLIVNK